MLIYNGIVISNEELDKIETMASKLNKFFNVPYDVNISLKEETRGSLKLTMAVVYKSKKIISTKIGTEKLVLARKALDDIVRQIRKEKTALESQRSLPVEPFLKDTKNKTKKKRDLFTDVTVTTTDSAISIMEGEGFSCFPFFEDNMLKIAFRDIHDNMKIKILSTDVLL